MTQMRVTQGVTTFTDVYNQFKTTDGSGSDKHVRFDNAKGLYTSPKASLARVVDLFGGHRLEARQQKQLDGAVAIRDAIRTEHPDLADRIFARLGQDHPGIDFSQGVRRGELDRIRDTIDAVVSHEAHLKSLSPNGMSVKVSPDDPGRLQAAFATRYNDQARNATTKYMQDNLGDMANVQRYPVRKEAGFPSVVEQFITDVNRSEIRLGGDRQSQGATLLKPPGKGPEDPRTALRRFAGSDNKALNLSKLCCQHLPTGLIAAGGRIALMNENGEKIDARLAAGKALPGNDKALFVSVREDNGRFFIKYECEHPLNGFSKPPDVLTIDGDKSWIKASMEISISGDDLEKGNLTGFQVTSRPELRLHAEITTDALAKQAAGQII